MKTPYTLVFVPASGDPGKLLAEGPGGAMPPRAWLCLHCECPFSSKVDPNLRRIGGYAHTFLNVGSQDHIEGCPGTGPTWDTDPENAHMSILTGLLLRHNDQTVMPAYDRLVWALWESGIHNRLDITGLREWIPIDDGDLEGLERALSWASFGAANFGEAYTVRWSEDSDDDSA
jgi:hypothetical protein